MINYFLLMKESHNEANHAQRKHDATVLVNEFVFNFNHLKNNFYQKKNNLDFIYCCFGLVTA